MSERFGALPLGELHAEGVCAYCGVMGKERGPGDDGNLRKAIHPLTLAVMHICIDTVACERRRYNSRRRI